MDWVAKAPERGASPLDDAVPGHLGEGGVEPGEPGQGGLGLPEDIMARLRLRGGLAEAESTRLGQQPGPRRRGGRRRPRIALGVNRWAVTGVGVALCLVAGVFVAAAFNSPSPADGAATGLTWDATPASATGDGAASPSAADLVVHVAGAVMAAGVYELSAGARVVDAIEAAGGAVEGADLSAINLAAVLADGERVYVPLPGETPPAVVSPGGLGVSGIGADGRVNVNTADAAELETLPGVGAVLAGRIIDFRTANGPFQQLGDLGEVSGIGPKILAGLAEAVTFG